MRRLIIMMLCGLANLCAMAQIEPYITPTATITLPNETKKLQTGDSYSGSAPLTVTFKANPYDDDGWNAYYEWRFYKEGEEDNPYLLRYEQDTEVTFTTAGAHKIVCFATFKNENKTIEYTKEYWSGEVSPISISISESKLEMPNAFSPNDDKINDVYKAKKGYQSIVEFKATIFNRWGVKLYEWDDPAGGWDGKYKGKDVAQGVYFVVVKARGADGRKFNIRRDVNLLRGYTEGANTNTGEQ